MIDTMFSLKEPKTGTDGTMSWTVDVLNPRTGDDFVLAVALAQPLRLERRGKCAHAPWPPAYPRCQCSTMLCS